MAFSNRVFGTLIQSRNTRAIQPKPLRANVNTFAFSIYLSPDFSGTATLLTSTDGGVTWVPTTTTYTTGGYYNVSGAFTNSAYRLNISSTNPNAWYEMWDQNLGDFIQNDNFDPLMRQLMAPGGVVANTANTVFLDARFNIKAANTGKIRSAIADMRRGISNAVINCIGDSTVRGLSTGGAATQGPSAWPVALAEALNARGINADGQNILGTGGYWGSGTTTAAQYATGDSRLSATAGTVPSSQESNLGGAPFNMVSGGSVSFTFAGVTHFDVVYRQRAGGGVFSWSIDGGGTTNINTTGADGIIRVNVGGALSLGSHTLKIDWFSGATVVFIGAIGYNNASGRKALQFLNLGISGATSTILLEDVPTGFGRKSGYKALSPALTIIEGGVINDGNQGVIPIATTEANLRSLIADAQLSGDVALSTAVFGSGNTWSTVQDSYAAMMYSVASDTGVMLWDIRKLWLSYANANSLGFTSDLVSHPSARGYRDIAGLYSGIIAQIAG